jgi:hypothetical protein
MAAYRNPILWGLTAVVGVLMIISAFVPGSAEATSGGAGAGDIQFAWESLSAHNQEQLCWIWSLFGLVLPNCSI